jgi:hypothetical protein
MTTEPTLTASPWSVTSARVIGSSHVKSGLPCQDDGLWRVVPNDGTLVLVVSDGAGSGKFTQFASAAAVRSCCYALRHCAARGGGLTCQSLRSAATHAAHDVLSLCKLFERLPRSQVELRDFACTLVVVAISGSKLLMLQIGDGAVVTDSPQGLRCLSPVLDREYVNETDFLVTPGALAEAFMLEDDASDVQGIALMSDGVQNIGIAYPSNQPFAGLFRPLFDYASSHRSAPQQTRDTDLERFLNGDSVNESTDDDRVLVLAVRDVT